MRLFLLNLAKELPTTINSRSFARPRVIQLLNQPMTGLSYSMNINNNIVPGYYSSIFGLSELEALPVIGRPGPWIFNLELPENFNLNLIDNPLVRSGYLSADAGFFFPASMFDLSRTQKIIDRDTSRRMGSFGFRNPLSNTGTQSSVLRASASLADTWPNEQSRTDTNVWTSTQTAEESNDKFKFSKLRIIKQSEEFSKFSRLLNFTSTKKTNLGINRMTTWRKRRLHNSAVYGKKLSIMGEIPRILQTPKIAITQRLPAELQIPLLSLEPTNLQQPFHQTVVRWKPSGATWWRVYRRIFSYQISRAPTQHREQLTQRAITRWVARCWRVLSFSSLKFWASTIASVLERVGWENTPNWVINQRAIENRLWQVYPGDIIQVRGLEGSRRKVSVSPISKLEPSRRALWVHWAPTLEVDELTYSVVIIHWGKSANVKTTTFPYLSHRLYNWKYRT